jgi:signal transduction histidine kinase
MKTGSNASFNSVCKRVGGNVRDEVNGTRQGYGLGLSIAHRIIRLLALNLDVRSEVGKGSNSNR